MKSARICASSRAEELRRVVDQSRYRVGNPQLISYESFGMWWGNNIFKVAQRTMCVCESVVYSNKQQNSALLLWLSECTTPPLVYIFYFLFFVYILRSSTVIDSSSTCTGTFGCCLRTSSCQPISSLSPYSTL